MPPYICFLCNFTSHTNRHTFRSNDNVFSAARTAARGHGPRSMKTGPRSMKLGPPSMKMGPRSVQEYKGHTGRVRTPRFELAEIWQP